MTNKIRVKKGGEEVAGIVLPKFKRYAVMKTPFTPGVLCFGYFFGSMLADPDVLPFWKAPAAVCVQCRPFARSYNIFPGEPQDQPPFPEGLALAYAHLAIWFLVILGCQKYRIDKVAIPVECIGKARRFYLVCYKLARGDCLLYDCHYRNRPLNG